MNENLRHMKGKDLMRFGSEHAALDAPLDFLNLYYAFFYHLFGGERKQRDETCKFRMVSERIINGPVGLVPLLRLGKSV